MKTLIIINVERETARHESIMKSQERCKESLNKLAVHVGNLQVLTGK